MNERELEYAELLWAMWIMQHGYEPADNTSAWATKERANAELGNRIAMTELVDMGMIINNPYKFTYQLNKEYQHGTNQSK